LSASETVNVNVNVSVSVSVIITIVIIVVVVGQQQKKLCFGSLENGNLDKAKSLASKGFHKKSGNLKR